MDSADSARPSTSSQAPPLHHHHSMQASVGGQLPPTPHAMNSQAAGNRPGIDRAHTFPTPPTSASSVLGIGSSNGSYEWNQQSLPNGVPSNQPLSIETGQMNNTRSMPTTPATTPPGQQVQTMQPYSGHQSYDNKQQYYATTPSSQTGYAQNGARYDGYKSDMGPPTAPNTGNSESHSEHKSDYNGHATGENPEHPEHGYLNSNSGYPSTRPEYPYATSQNHQQLSPEMTSSPHQAASGRGTPRTMPTGQPQWGGEYRTPPQSNQGSMYNPTGDSRSSNPAGSVDNYGSTGYGQSLKRRRDDDESSQRPGSRDDYPGYDQKRQKMNRPESFGMPLPTAHMQPIKTGPMGAR